MPDRRTVYVISDLHLGGVYPDSTDPEDRGFRICTHVNALTQFVDVLAAKMRSVELVINGDLVDFLAEGDDGPHPWVPIVVDQVKAAGRLDRIIDRDIGFFESLGRLLNNGHRLTLLLGNHDIELALPLVRERLAKRIGAIGCRGFQFIFDGEAYSVGNALIEHGNRYDQWNVVNHDALRRVRSLLSRNQEVPSEYAFEAPVGSVMVSDVINPIKALYRFVDLLSPYTAATVPILLALEPSYRRILTKVAILHAQSLRHRRSAAAMPSFGGDISSSSIGDEPCRSRFGLGESRSPADPLRALLTGVIANPDIVLDIEGGSMPGIGEDISTFGTIDRTIGLAGLILARDDSAIDHRIPALLAAIRTLQNDDTFARDSECCTEYLEAARGLARRGFECVIFGHTHYARDIRLTGAARYLNTGTWADVIRFPKEIVSGSEKRALAAVRAFIEDLRINRLQAWTSFTPTYVQIDLDEGGHVVATTLCDYSSPGCVE